MSDKLLKSSETFTESITIIIFKVQQPQLKKRNYLEHREFENFSWCRTTFIQTLIVSLNTMMELRIRNYSYYDIFGDTGLSFALISLIFLVKNVQNVTVKENGFITIEFENC